MAFASDGASVMVGKKSGVATLIKTICPNIILWHCLNHRVELAVADAIKDVRGLNHFQSFIEKLYNTYSMSPKNVRALQECSSALGKQVLKIGKIFGVRWIASSFLTVKAVWCNFEALYAHFQKDATSQNAFKGLSRRLCSPEFLQDLALMYDVLFELKELSELLQDRTTSLDKADKIIHRYLQRIQTMKEKPGTKTLEFEIESKCGIYRGVQLVPNKQHVPINRQQFLSSVFDNISARTNSSEQELMNQVRILNSDNWPTEIQSGYGQDEIRNLAKRLHLAPSLTADAFSDYVDNIGRRVPQNLEKLLRRLRVVPSSTAECERGFSAMNLICNDLRCRLSVPHMSALLFIKLEGPPLHQWNPSDYTRSWLRKHRSAEDTRIRPTSNKDLEEKALWKIL